MLGTQELLIIALVIFVLFGSSAIPKFAKSIGQAKKEFDKGRNETESDTSDEKKI
jgi:sec-independent protein translocase protein TatA